MAGRWRAHEDACWSGIGLRAGGNEEYYGGTHLGQKGALGQGCWVALTVLAWDEVWGQ